MHKYVHIPLPDPIQVKTLVSAYHRNLQKHLSDLETLGFEKIFYVESGSYSGRIDDVEYELNPGQIIVSPPDAETCSRKRNTAEVFILTFSSGSPALENIFKRVITITSRQHEMLRDIINSALDIIVWKREFDDYGFELKEGTDELTVQELKNKIELFLISLIKSAKEPICYEEKIFVRLTEYLKENIGERLTLVEIADEFSISVSKLKNICALQCKTSPIEYFIRLKIDEAKRLFEETKYNVSQVADALGFNSIHYFSTLFKRKCGVSPSQYAKLVRK